MPISVPSCPKTAAMALWLFCGVAFANPQNPHVVSGSASATQIDPATLHINASDKAIIHWDKFSINQGETTKFSLPSSSSAILNRVTGSDASALHGMLTSNGKVYLLNPNGVFIGETGIINTASFIASSLDVLDSDFLAGQALHFSGSSTKAVVNLGKITAFDGDVFLIGRHVASPGSIQASGTSGLAAGHDILLMPAGKDRIAVRPIMQEREDDSIGIDMSGTIQAVRTELKADGSLYSMAIKQSGMIDATDVVYQEGRIFLEAPGGMTEVTGSIKAPGQEVYVLGDKVALHEQALIDTSANNGGGKIFIGGGFQGKDSDILNSTGTFVGPDVKIVSDALTNGNAGQVVVWSDGSTVFQGSISAKGGPDGGNGGLMEVSGKNYLDFSHQAVCTRSAPKGEYGTLLLDPANLMIANTGGADVNLTNQPATTGTFPSFMYAFGDSNAAANVSVLEHSTLTGAAGLGSGSVVIMTGNDGNTGNGDIYWLDSAAVTVGTTFSLTLHSANNIYMYTTYDNSGGSGSLTMKAAGDITFTSQPVMGGAPTSQPQALMGTGGLTLDAGRNINLLATDATINISAAGGTEATPLSLTAQNGSINVISSSTSSASVSISSSGSSIALKAVEGNIELLAGGGAMSSISLNSGGGTGSVSLDATNGDIIMKGGTNMMNTVIISHSSTGPLNISAYNGDIMLTGGDGTSSEAQIMMAGSSPLNMTTTNGNIVLTAGQGGGSSSNAVITSMGFDTLNLTANGGNIRLVGAAQTSNTASIQQNGPGSTTLTTYNGDISLRAGVGMGSDVFIQHNSFNPLTLSAFDGDILLTGGENMNSSASINIGGACSATFSAKRGNIILQGGNSFGMGMTSVAQISSLMNGGAISLFTESGDIRLLGGSGTGNNAVISQQSNNSTTLQAMSGDIILLGGSNMSANAEIQHSSIQPLQLITRGGDIALTGGSGSTCHAQLVVSNTADVIVNATDGNILFTGGLGMGTSSNAQIVQTGGAIQLTTQGGDIQLLGGNSSTNFAQIQQFSNNPTTLIAKQGGIYLTGGTGSPAQAIIQHSSSQPLEMSALGGDIVFTGGDGNGSLAQIQIFGMLAPSIALATTDGSIFFKGGLGAGSGSSAGIFGPGSTMGDISLLANGGSVKLIGGSNNTNTAFIVQNGPGSTTLAAKQGDIALLGGTGGGANASITHSSLRPLEISTVQGSIFLTGGDGNTSLSQITSTGGDIRFSSDGCGIFLTGGLGTMGTMSTASIANTGTGAIFLAANGGPIEIKGGNAMSNTAFIQHTGDGPTTLKTTDGDILLQGGTQGATNVFIANSSLGSITLNTDNGNISLIGGIPNISFQSSARIQQTGGGMNMFPGPITLNANEGSILLVGGMSTQSDASITSTNGPVIVYAQEGDLRLLSNEGIGGGSSFTQISAGTTADILAGIDCILRAGDGAGMGQMYADISAGTLLSLSVGRNCTLSGGAGVGISGTFTGTQASLRGGAGMSTFIGGNWTITGGSGSNGFAGAFTPAGNMNFSIGGNLTLTAGSNAGTFAQIGHFLPTGVVNIDFQNVGGSVILQGSQTSNINNSPAVIGLGDLFNPVFSLSGDIVFSGSIGANLVLNGGFGAMAAGSDTFNFAQIGHFGRSAGGSITGDIRVANVGNNVVLFPSETYAAIGHGTTTLNWPQITGSVLIDNIGGDLSLTPGALVTMGANIRPTTQIGHVAALALLGDIFVSNVSGNITATGSDFASASAIIGHGNGRLLAGVSAQGQISVHASNIALNGGDETGAEAVIGFAGATTVISPAPLSVTAEHDITLAAGTPTAVGAFGGNAVIGFSNPNPATITNAVLSTISVTSELGGINIIGGVGDPMTAFTAGLAFIGMNNSNFDVMTPPISFANVVVSAPNGIISLQAVPFNSNFDYGNAAILNNQRGRVDPVDLVITAKDLSLLGGKPLPVMTPDGFGTVHIYSSRNAAFTIGNDLTLNAGLGTVEISNGTGNGGAPGVGTMSFDIGGNLTVLGGAGGILTSSAQIGFPEPFTGLGQTPIIFTRVGGDVIVQGGRGTNAFALIGHGRGANAGTISGDIIFDTIGGDVIVSGGQQVMQPGAFAHIGHVGTSAGGSIISGDVLLNNVAGSVRLNGGALQNTSAVIGHGDSGSNSSDSYSGQVVVHANGVQINAGGLGGAAIGFESNFPAGPTTISSNLVEVVSTAPITLTGGSGGNAVIGFFGNMGGGTTQIRNINVFADEGAISLTAGTAGGGFGGRAAIGTRALNGICQSEIAVKTNRELVLTGPATMGGAQALIANNNANIAAPFNVSIDPSTLILNGGTDGSGTAFIYSSDTLDIEVRDALYINANGQFLGGAQAGGATIQAQNTININAVTPSSAVIMMFGTTPMTFTTEIRSFGGDINIGSPLVLGADTITIGRPSMVGNVSLITQAGDIFIKTSGDISVLGGSAGTAEINANNAMGQAVKSVDIRTAGDLLVSGFGGPGQIIATGDVNINTGEDPSGTITILGGTVGGLGQIQSSNGNINIGTPMLIGASTLTVGSNTSTNISRLAAAGDIFAKISGDVNILGGNMVTSEVNAGRTLSLLTTGDISVLGFSGLAQMLATGDIDLNTGVDPSGTLTITGGAMGGPGLVQTSSGNINIGTPDLIGFDSITVGNTTMMGPAHLISQTGDVFANISGDLSIVGGAAMAATGLINAANDIVLITGGDISLTGATGSAQATTTNGLINFTVGDSISLSFNSNISNAMGTNTIFLSALANLNLLTPTSTISNTGGGDIRATLGQDLAMTNGSIIANGNGGVSVSAGRNISVLGGTVQGGGLMNFNADETITVSGSVINTGNAGSNTLLSALVNLNIVSGTISSSGGGDIQANLGNDLSMTNGTMTLGGGGNIQVLAGRHITASAASITNTGSGEMYLVADYNMTLSNSTVTTASGTLVLVVDNEFPDPPKYGTGTLTISGGTVSSGGDKRYYIPRQRYNQVAGFAKGTEYTDTTSEIWNSYFNRSLEGSPLTVFYKDSSTSITPTPTPVPPHLSPRKYNRFIIAISEALQDWRTYDDFLFAAPDFSLDYRCSSSTDKLKSGSVASCQMAPGGRFRFLRPSHRNYHTKKLELSL